MRYRIRPFCILAATATLLVTGCSVKMNQLETAKRLVPAVQRSLGADASEQGARYAWEFAFAGAVFTVFPTRVQGQRVTFRNRDNVEIVWDGQSLIRINGFPGALGKYEQGTEGEGRWYAQDGMATARVRCNPQYQWRLSPDRSGWRQICSGIVLDREVQTEHAVEFNRDGRLVEIRSTLVVGMEPATLRLLLRE